MLLHDADGNCVKLCVEQVTQTHRNTSPTIQICMLIFLLKGISNTNTNELCETADADVFALSFVGKKLHFI